MTHNLDNSISVSEVVVFKGEDGQLRVDVKLDQETVWLTQRQMAEVFQTSVSNINLHLKNIYASNELEETATIKEYLIVQTEGGRKIQRSLQHYNLDTIISLGYRVDSRHGIFFRQWATRIIREHLVRGFTANREKLAERGLREVHETLDLLARTLKNQQLVDDTGQIVLDIITEYTATWRLLLEYDENQLQFPTRGSKPCNQALNYEQALDVIARFRQDLDAKGEASSLFGNCRGDALEAILGNIEQTMLGEPLYQTLEAKAAHLLYFIIKDHPFTDGNKRIGSLLFLLYLEQEKMAHRINPQALTALTLLIATSVPSEKDLIIRLIANLLSPPE
ncbi:MAG: Fic/DOC family protein [Gammaproteobacteria bacterium]|nr:Fic/DOC family protein [Gammaproteobacteria bacterium]